MILFNCKEFTAAAASGELEDASLWVRFSAWAHTKICPPCLKFMRQLALIAASARIRKERALEDVSGFLQRTVDRLSKP